MKEDQYGVDMGHHNPNVFCGGVILFVFLLVLLVGML